MRVRVGEEGTWYEFEGDRLLVKEARELQELTGMGLQDFSDGIRHGKVDALVFMLYLARRRAGEAVRFRDFDDMNLAELKIEDDDGQAAEEQAAPESDASPLIAVTANGAVLPPPTELRPPPPKAKPRKATKRGAATG